MAKLSGLRLSLALAATLLFHQTANAEPTVRFEVPLSTPFTGDILARSGAKYMYPQQSCLDEKANRLFVINATRGGNGDRSQWASVYDWTNGKFLTTFQVGDGLGETCVIDRNGPVSYLWVKSKGNNLLKFNVTGLPTAMSKPAYEGKSKASVFYQATKSGDSWLAEQKTPNRDVFQVLDWTFKPQGAVTIKDPDLQNEKHPKRQALATWKGRIIASYGSNYIAGRDPVLTKFGIKIFDSSGQLLSDETADPTSVMAGLNKQGVPTSRLENEGVFVTSGGEVYVLAITQAANSPAASTGGLAIIRATSLK